MTSSWVRMKQDDEPPSVTLPSSIIQASPAPASAAACFASTCASRATLLISRRTQRRSGTVITPMPVLADSAFTMSLTEVNITSVGLTSALGNAKSRPVSAPRVTSR